MKYEVNVVYLGYTTVFATLSALWTYPTRLIKLALAAHHGTEPKG
jgi:hypothetical protein